MGEKPGSNPYFTAMAPSYFRSTGNTTSSILREVLEDKSLPLKLSGYSVVHDNASGPGNATAEIVRYCVARGIEPPTVIATDENEAMIAEVNKLRGSEKGWKNVTAQVTDSSKPDLKDDFFTHSFTNFSVANFKDPSLCLRHIHRTLRPKGIAIVTTWRRFAVAEMIKEAREIVKGQAEGEASSSTMTKAVGDEFMDEGHLVNLMDKAGWEIGKLKVREKSLLLQDGEDLDGLIEFMSGDFTKPARQGWSDEENAKWPDAVKQAVAKEKERNGGVKMDAWIVLGQKWDALAG